MILEPFSKHKGILIAVMAAFLAAGGLYMVMAGYFAPEKNGTEPVFCTQEAKLCPDGSYVGRTGPDCEFAPCPGGEPECADAVCPGESAAGDSEGAENPWLDFVDESAGVSFKYPDGLLAEYIFTVDWPPQVQVQVDPIVCTEAGEATARTGRTEKRLVDDREYCVTEITEGAAGSSYIQYAYAFPKEGKSVYLTFSLRFPQCANYDEARKSECEREREAFDLDGLIDRIAGSQNFIRK